MVIVDIKLLSGFTADTSMVHLSVSSQTCTISRGY